MILELTDDQKAFQQRIAVFATEHVAPRAAGIDEDGQFPRDLVQAVARQGLMGVTVGKSWGGAGLDYVSYALAIEELARASAVVSVIVSVNNSLVSEPLEKFGSDAQRDAWMRRLVSGEALGAFALSEEQAGSDAANQQTVARLDNEGYVLNGRKVWVANAEAADIAIVFATTQPTPGSGQNIGGRSISAFLVPLDSAGITRVVTADSLGVRGLGCMDLEFKDVRIGAEALLGGPGEGFHIAMWALDGGRVDELQDCIQAQIGYAQAFRRLFVRFFILPNEMLHHAQCEADDGHHPCRLLRLDDAA